jgi:hypothetical protein
MQQTSSFKDLTSETKYRAIISRQPPLEMMASPLAG